MHFNSFIPLIYVDTDDTYQPAIKLIEFFRRIAYVDQIARQQGKEDGEVGGQPMFSTEKIQTISVTMKQLPLLGKKDAALWVKYWKDAGLFEK